MVEASGEMAGMAAMAVAAAAMVMAVATVAMGVHGGDGDGSGGDGDGNGSDGDGSGSGGDGSGSGGGGDGSGGGGPSDEITFCSPAEILIICASSKQGTTREEPREDVGELYDPSSHNNAS